MKNVSALKLAEALLQDGDLEKAEAALSGVDRNLLPAEYERIYLDVLSRIGSSYA